MIYNYLGNSALLEKLIHNFLFSWIQIACNYWDEIMVQEFLDNILYQNLG
mgnify:CR=1 FL=1